MSDLGIPQIGTPLIDPSGRISRPWWIFFQGIFDRVGGSLGASNDDILADLPEDSGIEEIKADLYRIRNELNSTPAQAGFLTPEDSKDARIQALEAQLAQVMQDLEALKQGVIL